MSRGLSSTLTHGHQVPKVLSLSNGRPHPLFIEGGPKLAVTLKSHENRVFVDCPPHKSRTVRHSNPTARTAMIICQSRPLEPLADCPHTWGGPSAVQNFEPTDLQMSLTKFSTDLRTVRTPGADRPPFTLKSHQSPNTSLVNLLSDLWTVRSPCPDRPQSNLSAQARETTTLDDFFKTPADCPHPRGGPSAVRPSSPNRAATSLDKKN